MDIMGIKFNHSGNSSIPDCKLSECPICVQSPGKVDNGLSKMGLALAEVGIGKAIKGTT